MPGLSSAVFPARLRPIQDQNMQPHSYRAAIEDYIRREARPPDKFSHQPRLYHLATQVGAGMGYDDDVLHAAAWLHDLGVFIGHRPEEHASLAVWDNTAYAMKMAPSILREFGFPAAKTGLVVEAIRTHQPSANPTSMEGTILRDADILEQLGAVGILRAVSKVGRDTRYPLFADALRLLERNLETLPTLLRLDRAKFLADERVKTLRGFIQAARTEAGGQPL